MMPGAFFMLLLARQSERDKMELLSERASQDGENGDFSHEVKEMTCFAGSLFAGKGILERGV